MPRADDVTAVGCIDLWCAGHPVTGRRPAGRRQPHGRFERADSSSRFQETPASIGLNRRNVTGQVEGADIKSSMVKGRPTALA